MPGIRLSRFSYFLYQFVKLLAHEERMSYNTNKDGIISAVCTAYEKGGGHAGFCSIVCG